MIDTKITPDCKLELEFYRLAHAFEKQKEAIGFLQAQVQSLTHRVNCLSDKSTDLAFAVNKLIE